MPLLAWLFTGWLVSIFVTNEHALLFFYVAAAALIYAITLWLAFRFLDVQIVEWVAKVSGGEKLPFSVALINSWPVPLLNLQAQMILINSINQKTQTLELKFDVNPFTDRLVTWNCPPLPRGKYNIANLVLTGGDIFRLVSWQRSQKLHGEIKVYPVILPVAVNYYPIGYAGEGEEQYARLGAGTIPAGIRNYYPGDNLTRIHWKASARWGKLLTKEFSEESGNIRVIVLGYGGSSPEENEALVTAAATMAWIYFKRGLEFYFLVYDRNAGSLGMVHTREDMERVLERLTVAVPKEENTMLEGLPCFLLRVLPPGAGELVLLTGALVSELPENLQRIGLEIKVVSVPPDLDQDRIMQALEGIGPC